MWQKYIEIRNAFPKIPLVEILFKGDGEEVDFIIESSFTSIYLF